MLPERVFELGGLLSMLAGGLLAVAFLVNPVPALWDVVPAAAFLLAFGAFFVYVGRGARTARRKLLETPRSPL